MLAGTQVAGLLFFLNPHLEFAAGPVVRAMIVYAGLLGFASLLVHLPFTWDQPRRALRALPWALVLVFTAAGIAHWTHASFFDFYLPAGINRRLIKAALWLSLAAVVTFYTALLHSVQNRPYGVRSRAGLTLLALAAVYVVVERREAFRPAPEATPRSTVIEEVERPNLLVVDVPAATLDAVLPLAQQGQLPFLARLLEEGAHGRLETLGPTRPRPLSTTLATGRYPYRHGVVAREQYPAPFVHADARLRLIPLGMGFRYWGVPDPLAEAAQSDTLALWAMVDRLGISATRVGWAVGNDAATRDLAPAAVASAFDAASFSDLDDEALRLVQGQLRRDRARLGTSLEPLRDRSTQAHFLQLPGLQAVALRYYGGWEAFHLEGSQREADAHAARAVTGYYAALDSELERLWQTLEAPRLIAIVSSFGTRGPGALEQFLASLQPDRAVRGYTSAAPDGLFLLAGPGVSPGQFLNNVRVTDVAPTLLYALGLPVARDLDGRALTEAFSDEHVARRALTFVPSYETLRPLLRRSPAATPAAGP